jgi:hypothetical protein
MAASGTTKKVTLNQLLGAGGTATLASATITGDLTAQNNIYVPGNVSKKIGPVGSTWGGLRFDSTNQPFLDSDIGITFRTGGSTSFTTSYVIGATGISTWFVGGSTAMTLNSTGLGVGVTPSYRLHVVQNSSNRTGWFEGSNTLGTSLMLKNTSAGGGEWSLLSFGSGNAEGAGNFGIANLGGNRLTIDSSGNVGVSVTPSAWQSSVKAVQLGGAALSSFSTYVGFLTSNAYNDGAWKFVSAQGASRYEINANVHSWHVSTNSPSIGGAITFTQAMTLDASGNLLVGLTVDSFAPAKGVSMFAGNSSRVAVGHANGTASGDYYHSFAYNSTVIGSITQNGTTGVLFNTSSDYRLKDSVKPLSGGLARINALKPSIYKWKSDGSAGEGFLAHELAEVVPFAVSGEKDAVNADGSIKSQGIDMSRIVPILVAAIKELTARVEALEA